MNAHNVTLFCEEVSRFCWLQYPWQHNHVHNVKICMGASATVHCQGLYGFYDCYLLLSRFQQIMSLPSTGCLLLTMSFMRYEMSFLIFSIFIKSNKVSSAEFTSSDILLLFSWSYCVCFWWAICPHQHVKLTFNIKIFG